MTFIYSFFVGTDSKHTQPNHKWTKSRTSITVSYSTDGYFARATIGDITLCSGIGWITRHRWWTGRCWPCKSNSIATTQMHLIPCLHCNENPYFPIRFSYWKRLDGVYWWALVLFMAVFTSTNACHGTTRLKSEHSKSNTCNMQRENWS